MNKKGLSMWGVIMGGIVAVVLVVVVLVIFAGRGKDISGFSEEKIKSLTDCDKDNVADLFDRCKCVFGESNGKYDGCPDDVIDEASLQGKKSACTKEEYEKLCVAS